MAYIIVFDFPEAPGEPVFAGEAIKRGDPLSIALHVETAKRFPSEEIAERFLAHFGPSMRACGSVAEVPNG